MLVLVLFTDNVFLICEPSDVSAVNKKCPAVKYTDGKKYTARILALHEDRVVLEEIKTNLEDESKSVFFKTVHLTEEEFSYTDVIDRHRKYPDAGKLYLDPILLPSQNENSKTCGFTFRGQDETKDIFKIQSKFVGQQISRPKIDESPPVLQNRNSETNNCIKILPAEQVDNLQNVTSRKCSKTNVTLEKSVNGKESDLNTWDAANNNTKKFITGNQSHIKQSLTKRVSHKKNPTNLITTRQLRSSKTIPCPTTIVLEQISNEPKTKHIAAKSMNNEDNMRGATPEYQATAEKAPIENTPDGRPCSARNILALASKNLSENENSSINNTSIVPVVNDNSTTNHNIENRVFDPAGTTKRITNAQMLERNKVTDLARNDSTKEAEHDFEHQKLSEKKMTQRPLNDQKLIEKNLTSYTSKNEISAIEYKQMSEAQFLDNGNAKDRDVKKLKP